MTWLELNEARRFLGLTEAQMSKLLRVSLSTYKGWGVRGKVPRYISASVDAHLLLSQRDLASLTVRRNI